MKLRWFKFAAAASAVFAATLLSGARRPRYGGTLRVEIGAGVASLDPSAPPAGEEEAGAREMLESLMLERLVRLDAQARPQSWLAASWNSSPSGRAWTFFLRPGVQMSDGSPLTPADVAASLAAVEPQWKIASDNSGRAVVITTGQAEPDLPSRLAEARYPILRRTPEGVLLGTGPFRLDEWEPRHHAHFTADDNYWGGRPFLDAVDISSDVAPRDRLINLALGKADLAVLPPEIARRASEQGVRVTFSAPAESLAVVFLPGRPAAEDPRIRQALALSLDRAALVNFVLQKQGEPSGALLPQWLGGTSFLFSTAADVAGARRILSQMGGTAIVRLGYDASDALEQGVAERIGVNAREAGIAVASRPVASGPDGDQNFDAKLIRLRLDSPVPRLALNDLLGGLSSLLAEDATPMPASATAEEIYARQRAVVDSFRVIPLVHLPGVAGVGARVRNWTAPSGPELGQASLANLWLEENAP